MDDDRDSPEGEASSDPPSATEAPAAPAQIDYGLMIQEALRSVVRRTLALTAESGLPGDHHFYIEFRTDAEGVEMPASLRAVYPERMRIVLQHRFWNLEVDSQAFGVELRFSGTPSRLRVPFQAVTAFVDPAAGLSLQFDRQADGAAEHEAAEDEGGASAPTADKAAEVADETGRLVSFEAFRRGRR